MRYALKQWSYLCIYDFPLGYLVLSYFNHFIYTCFFVDVYHQGLVHLETYTYERGLLLSVSYLFWVTLFIIFDSLVASKINISWVLVLFYLHLCALMSCWRSLTSCLPWWVCWFLLAKYSHELLVFSIGFSFQLVPLSLWTYSF